MIKPDLKRRNAPMFKIKQRELSEEEFREFLELTALMNIVSNKLNKVQQFKAVITGPLKNSANNFDTKLQSSLNKIFDTSGLLHDPDMLQNIQLAHEAWLSKSIEERVNFFVEK